MLLPIQISFSSLVLFRINQTGAKIAISGHRAQGVTAGKLVHCLVFDEVAAIELKTQSSASERLCIKWENADK